MEDKEKSDRPQRMAILIVDDDERARKGLQALLSTIDLHIDKVIEGTNGYEAIKLVEKHQPHLVIIDAQMPLLGGVEATKTIKRRWPETKVFFLTLYHHYQAAALAAGADVFLLKGGPTEALVQAMIDYL